MAGNRRNRVGLTETQEKLWEFLRQRQSEGMPKKSEIARFMGVKDQSVDSLLRGLARYGLLIFGMDGWQFAQAMTVRKQAQERAVELSVHLPATVLDIFPNRNQERELLERIEGLCIIMASAVAEGYSIEDDRPFGPEEFAGRVNAYRAEMRSLIAEWLKAATAGE